MRRGIEGVEGCRVLYGDFVAGARVAANAKCALHPTDDREIAARGGFEEQDYFFAGMEARHAGDGGSEIANRTAQEPDGYCAAAPGGAPFQVSSMAKDVKVQISPASQAVEFARQRARMMSGAVCAIFASDMCSSVVARQKVAASSTAISTAAVVADAVAAATRAAAGVDRVRLRVRISFHLEHSGGRPAIVVQSSDEERADAGESGAAEL